MLDITPRSGLSEEQRLMRQSCRDFVDEVVTPFIRSNWQREWDMNPQARLPPEILQGAEEIGIRTLGVPEESRAGTPALPTSWCRTGRSRCCCATSRRVICRRNGSNVWSRIRSSCSRTA
ncbi:MAG: acyl-CoA dehydrogenase family protein [Alphaproteobacteria bacterium]|nr:MAG: acyl-CoA dehydrogenase family protein [Alphaproteobacteria bacterium]